MSDNRNRLRPKQIKFFVNDKEYELIRKKMAQMGTDNMSAYLRKMAIDGYVFYKSVNGVWLTKEVPVKYFKRDSFDFDTVNEIATRLRDAFAAEDKDAAEEHIVQQYSWEYVQQALFAILLDDNSTDLQYDEVANIIWNAVLDGQKIRKTTAIALLYYRLGDINAPYENNTIWSIASTLFDLDYANAEYNPLKDEKIIKKLAFYGLSKKHKK